MPWSSSRLVLAVGLAAFLLRPAPVGADEHSAQAKARTLLMLRILAYDHGLKQRAGERLTLLVLHHPTDAASLRRRDEILESFKGLEKIKVAGLPITVTAAAIGDPALLA